MKIVESSIPGWIGTGALVLASTFWVYWGGMELFHEAWWGPLQYRFLYLTPATATLVLTALLMGVPRVGAVVSLAGGIAFTAWWAQLQLGRGGDFFSILLSMPFSGSFVFIALMFWLEGTRRVRGGEPSPWRWAVAFGPPALMALGIAIVRLPPVLSRTDDGNYGERRIVGNEVDLIWAGEGDGWNPGLDPNDYFGAVSDQEAPTWEYARDKCAGLEPAGTWRLPTSDELVRTLIRSGENAGCVPPEEEGIAVCDRQPEKETPLWRPQASPIYLWSGDEIGDEARYVSFNGWVYSQEKYKGNSRHGYRCVREP